MCKCQRASADIEASVGRHAGLWCELKPRLIDHVTAHLPCRPANGRRRAVGDGIGTSAKIDVTQLSCSTPNSRPGDGCIRLYINRAACLK